MAKSPELFAFIPWTEDFPSQPAPSSMMGPNGAPKISGYLSPDLFFAADTTAWLLGPSMDGHILRIPAGKSPEPFPLPTNIRKVLSAAPGPKGGLILFGTQEAGRILVRLSDRGETIWQVEHFESEFANSGEAKLFTDSDGSVYLYTAIRQQRRGDGGTLSKVNLENGSLATLHQFAGFPPERAWARDGKLFWVAYREQKPSWVSLNPETGEQRTVAVQPSLQPYLWTCGPLADGGALLSSVNKKITWMKANGEQGRQVDLSKANLAGSLFMNKTVVTLQGDVFVIATNANGLSIYKIAADGE